MNDPSSTDIKANAANLFTSVNDSASLNLVGTTESHIAIVGSLFKMKMGDFTDQESNIKASAKSVLGSNNKSCYDDLNSNLLEKIF